MRKILLSVMLVLVLSAGACADIVYSTEDGSLGTIRIEKQTSADVRGIKYEGSGEDTLLGSYWDGDNSRIILVNRTTDYNTSGDTAYIFNPGDMSKPIEDEPKVLSGVYNTSALTGTNNGRGLYFASGASVREFSTETFKRTRTYICETVSGDTVRPSVKSVVAARYTVYVMAEEESSGDVVMVFDGQLRDDIDEFRKRQAPEGTSAITCLSNWLLVAAHEKGVDGLGSSGFYEIVSTDSPVKAICRDNERGFYFAEQSDDGETALKHYNKNGEVSTLVTENVAGECSLLYDETDGVMCAVLGDKLMVYSLKDDTLIDEFSSSELGGTIRHVTSGTVKGEEHDNNSGCNLSGLGIILMSLLVRRRK